MAKKHSEANLNEIIKIKSGFQSSVNIAYDIDRIDKISDFIATKSSVEIIERMLLATANNETRRSKILVGAYGKGKSHLILIILAILYNKDRISLSRVLEYIKNNNKRLYGFIKENFIKNNKTFIPVVIDGNNSDLEQAFIVGLQNTIKKYKLDDIELNTNYQAVLNKIADWKSNYQFTYDEFLSKLNCSVESFIQKINRCDSAAYNKFIGMYPSLTAGSEFQPMIGFNVVNLYTEFTNKVVERGYSGIYIVFDEFSKYLESSITTATLSETKLLQDLAERCARSGSKQMHFLLITHKDIANYIDKLPKDKVDGWKGVSERFEHIEIRSDYSQLYEIISNVIYKDKDLFKKYITEYDSTFKELINTAERIKLFSDVENVEDVIKGTFPLHPVTSFILPRLSELIAQNERTLFTFLSLDSKYTLCDYIKKSIVGFSLLTPDVLYDYFEPLFRQESYLSNIKKYYDLSSKILHRLDDELSKSIVKTIALIYMVNQFDRLTPTRDTVIYVFNSIGNNKNVLNCLNDLENEYYFIYENQSNKYIQLKDTTGVNIRKKCLDEVERIKNKNYSIADLLNMSHANIYFYPSQYNDEKQVVRYMKFSFVSINDLSDKTDNYLLDDENNKYLDGMVYGILDNDEYVYEDILNKIKEISSSTSRCVFIVPKKRINISEKIYLCQAILNLKKQALSDIALQYEYDILLNDVLLDIDTYVGNFTSPEDNKTIYFYNGEEKKIYRKKQLSELLSNICEAYYYKYPIINNEIINKNNLSKVAITARTKLINGLLEDVIQPLFGEKGNSQCLSFARSVLVRTGLLENFDKNPTIKLDFNNNNIGKVVKVINDFFVKSNKNNPSSFEKIYDILRNYKYHYGIKKGIIPIFLTVVMSVHKKNLVITHNNVNGDNNELPITAELINAIDINPANYNVYYDTWDEQKDKYIQAIRRVFNIQENISGYNSLSIITKNIQQWYFNLPAISRETNNYVAMYSTISSEIDKNSLIIASNKIKKKLHSPINNHSKFIFKNIVNLIDRDDVKHFEELLKVFKEAHDFYKTNLSRKIMEDVKNIFLNNSVNRMKKMCLISALTIWFNNFNTTTKENVFSGSTRNFIGLIKEGIQDDDLCLDKLAPILTGIRIEDWNDKTINEFFSEINNIKNTVEKYDKDSSHIKTESQNIVDDTVSNDEYIIISYNNFNEKNIKRIKKIEYKNNKRANLLKNEIETSIDEMGESMSNEEMRQVLLEIVYTMS